MKIKLLLILIVLAATSVGVWLYAQPATDPLVEGYKITEVSAVADAVEQLYGQKVYMYHDMRPLFTTKFAGPAVTVMVKKEEHHEGARERRECWTSSTSRRPALSTWSSWKMAWTSPPLAASCQLP